MNRTQIEWVRNPDGSQGYTFNPITGCLNHDNGLCKGGGFPCYAYKLAHGRLKPLYLANKNGLPYSIFEKPVAEELKAEVDPFYPRFWEDRLACQFSYYGKKKQGIFVCDMGDLLGIGIPENWTWRVMQLIKAYPQHRFYILTKQAQRLPDFSPFPDNAWVGVTATSQKMFDKAIYYLSRVDAKIKFISLEPLLESIKFDNSFSIGYNAEYEGKEQRGDSISSSKSRGVRDRQGGSNLEDRSSEVGQVERREQDDTLPSSQGRERYREILTGESDDRGDKILCSSSQVSMASLQRGNPSRHDNQSQERLRERQSLREYGANDLQPEHEALNSTPGQNIQARQTWSLSWVIIGACTGTFMGMVEICNRYPELTLMPSNKRWTLQPPIEWVREIVEAADKAGIKVFLKDNLRPLLIPEDCSKPNYLTEDIFWASEKAQLRQEMP